MSNNRHGYRVQIYELQTFKFHQKRRGRSVRLKTTAITAIVQVYYCTIKFKSGVELSSITKHELSPAMRAFCRKPLLKKRLYRCEYLLPFVAAVDDGNNTDGSN